MGGQSNKQGIFNERVEHLNKFRRIMTDVNLKHHMISQDAVVHLFDRSFDMYEDISSISPYEVTIRGFTYKVKPFIKRVLFSKSPSMSYVQQTFKEFLVENVEQYPYLVQITSTGMPRMLNLGDRLVMGDIPYEVKLVEPINRLNDSVQRVMVVPVNFSDVPVVDVVVPTPPVEVDDRYKKLNVM